MRALRDFNITKIVTDDIPIIMGLIGDLFPALNVPRKRNMDFEAEIRQATLDQKLQPEENFILKVCHVCVKQMLICMRNHALNKDGCKFANSCNVFINV